MINLTHCHYKYVTTDSCIVLIKVYFYFLMYVVGNSSQTHHVPCTFNPSVYWTYTSLLSYHLGNAANFGHLLLY